MPGEEAATEVVTQSFDTMGPAAGMFLLLLAIVVGMFYLASLWIKNHKKNGVRREGGGERRGKKKDTPEPVPTRTWFEGVSASLVRAEKEKTDESQDAAIKGLENSLTTRIDELFRVEGEHQKETKTEIKEILAKLEAHRVASHDKNERQDELINALRESTATLKGMIKASSDD